MKMFKKIFIERDRNVHALITCYMTVNVSKRFVPFRSHLFILNV